MLAEIRATNPNLNVEILGVNMLNDALFNPLVVSQRTLPWLQETAEANAWGKWNVTWRDVRIVDSQGRLHSVYNLTAHDLANEMNRASLKQLFLSAAKIVDSDGDQLPDDWEMQYFGSLTAGSAADSDRDGADNFREYAFGTNPLDANSRPVIAPRIVASPQGSVLNLKLRRRAGAYLDYRLDESTGVQNWSASTALAGPEWHNMFDGTGTVEATYLVPANLPERFFRLRVLPSQ
jgi:hypothetical protein